MITLRLYVMGLDAYDALVHALNQAGTPYETENDDGVNCLVIQCLHWGTGDIAGGAAWWVRFDTHTLWLGQLVVPILLEDN